MCLLTAKPEESNFLEPPPNERLLFDNTSRAKRFVERRDTASVPIKEVYPTISVESEAHGGRIGVHISYHDTLTRKGFRAAIVIKEESGHQFVLCDHFFFLAPGLDVNWGRLKADMLNQIMQDKQNVSIPGPVTFIG